MKRALLLMAALLGGPAALARDVHLPWRFMDPVAAAGYRSLREESARDPVNIAFDLALNEDPDDRQGRGEDGRRAMNFDPARDLLTIVEDLGGDGRPKVFLLFNTAAISGNWGGLWGVVMVEDAPGRWREACSIAHRSTPPVGAIRLPAAPLPGWRNFRTDEGTYGWRPIADGSGRMECTPPEITAVRAVRGPRRRARWVPWQRPIHPMASDALREFRLSNHPIADAMAINHEGARIGINRTPGRPRNFDPAFDLLYAVHEMGGNRGPLVFLLFDWPMLRREGEPLPGVVMVEDRASDTPRQRWRIACTIADAGDRGAGGGITLLDGREEGLRGFRTSAGHYAWQGATDVPGQPECRRLPP